MSCHYVYSSARDATVIEIVNRVDDSVGSEYLIRGKKIDLKDLIRRVLIANAISMTEEAGK